jgi:hypothetical protein
VAAVDPTEARKPTVRRFGRSAPPLPVLPPGTLIDELEQLSRDLLMAADTLDRDHAGMSWAIDRVAAKQKPSSAKGTTRTG